MGAILVAFGAAAILTNVLFMQSGSHPAPMFKSAMASARPMTASNVPAAAVPRPRQSEPAPTPVSVSAKAAASRTPGEIIGDIQRELARRGYYDGVTDGLYGPKTDGAIRDFEQAAGLKPSVEPNEALLQAITRAPAKLAKGTTGASPAAIRPAAIRNEAVAERATPSSTAPSRRVIALQRALAEYGYGQIKSSGIVDSETHAAIERFERERKLPITGQASDRVVRELAAMTGRPLE
jgi:peptidoglycan hydrolase-like protein with peptidoglycan-binding domain